jgi:hypothetical protein
MIIGASVGKLPWIRMLTLIPVTIQVHRLSEPIRSFLDMFLGVS